MSNVPKLRFSEFQDTDDWEEKPLKEVFSIFQGFAFSSKDSVKGGTRWLKIADVSIQEMNPNTPSFLPTAYKEKHKKYLVKQGDYAIALTRPILSSQLKIAPVDKVFHEALLNQRVGKIETPHDISFVYFLLQTSQLICNIETGISGSEPPNLSAKQIENINTFIPSAPEQQKIANCLSSIDTLITAQTQKLDTLKAHKKGLMQQLFPATGETIPKRRFPEFRDAGDWEEKVLGDVMKFTGGGTPSKSNTSYWGGDNPWISSSDISEESIFNLNIHKYISEKAIQESATKIVPANSILLVSRVGVGKLAITNQQICTSQDFTNLTPVFDDLIFMAYLLKTKTSVFFAFNQGMAIKGFTKDDVVTLRILLPIKEEQQKVANCLSSIDDLITAQTQKIESLKAHKKGLMQQLFPASEEMA